MKTSKRRTLICMISVLFLMLCAAIGTAWFGSASDPTAHAATSESTETSLSFLLNEDAQSYKVKSSDRTLKNVTIPSSYNELPVTAIADNGFMGCTALEKIIIPSSVSSIGNNAFMLCSNLKQILGMSGVTSYGNNAFSMCSNLDYLILPGGLTNVGTNMLQGVKANVYSRTMEEDLLRLNSSCLMAFAGNIVYGNQLVYRRYETGVAITPWQNLSYEEPTQLIVESWHSDTREGISEDEKIEGPVLQIDQYAFCNSMVDSITLRNSEGYNHSINIESYAFMNCTASNLKIEVDITMNDSAQMTGLSCSLFSYCTALQSVTLPGTINMIADQMFSDCSNLEKIEFLDESLDDNVLPIQLKSIGDEAFSSCSSIPELSISENIEYIGANAFFDWGSNANVYQNIYIHLEEAGDWHSLWKSGINSNNCNLEFTGSDQLNVQFVVDQDGVINAVGGQSITVARNDTLNDLDLNDPASDSHEFNGVWYTTESREAGTEYDWNRPIKSNLTLYAGWDIKMFEVRFQEVPCCSFIDINGHTPMALENTYPYGTSVMFYLIKNYGYDDIECFRNGELLIPFTGDVYQLDIFENIVITVTSKLHLYHISYLNVRGGYNPNVTEFTVASDTIKLVAPSWDAYEIGYWDISVINPKEPHEDITYITATWENPRRFTITFTLDDDPNASNPNGSTRQYTVEDSIQLFAPNSLGYESGVWMTADGEIISGWEPDEYCGNIELFVQWGAGKRFEVSFDLNGGNGDATSIVVAYGDLLPEKATPTWYDYKFLGFYSVNNGNQYYTSSMGRQKWYQLAGDTLQAKWEREYFYVTFKQEKGIGGTTQLRLKYGAEWDDPITVPTRKGYSFVGYYYLYTDLDNYRIYNADGSFNPNNKPTSKWFFFKQDITLEGVWQAEDYYGFTIQKLHARDTSAGILRTYYMTYDGSFTYTAPERMVWTKYDGQDIEQQESCAFTYWLIKPNEPIGYNEYPWLIYSFNLTIEVNVASLINSYYPEYAPPTRSSVEILIRAYYANDPIDETPKKCIAEGSLITLDDGRQIPVEQLTGNERLLVWNLCTGKFDSAPILFIDHDPAQLYEVINLYFSDGTSVKVISEHAFWDFDLNQYVYLRKDAAQYIGHWFNKQITDENGNLAWARVQLVNVIVQDEYTTAWSPVTASHLCYYVNGMLSMPGGIEGFINIFEVDADTLTINAEALRTDIECYGLFTYEEFAAVLPIPEEIFNAFNGQYLKIAMGKGLIDWDTLAKLVERYQEFF